MPIDFIGMYRGYRLEKVDTDWNDDWYSVLVTNHKSNLELGIFDTEKKAKDTINRLLDGDRRTKDGRRVWSI